MLITVSAARGLDGRSISDQTAERLQPVQQFALQQHLLSLNS
jgi:hypothetical protein